MLRYGVGPLVGRRRRDEQADGITSASVDVYRGGLAAAPTRLAGVGLAPSGDVGRMNKPTNADAS
jgi:hypothetical protein